MRGPSGTVTFLFPDIEGSTRMWEQHPGEMRVALERHDVLLRDSIEGAHGFVFKTVCDAFCAAFSDAAQGLEAAVAAQRAIDAEEWPDATPIRVRMALHTGVSEERSGDYFGPAVNRTARLEAIAHGGQTVMSSVTAALLDGRVPAGVALADAGEHRLKDLSQPERVVEVRVEGLRRAFPPLRSLDNPALRNNLPAQTSSFVGRAREVGIARDLVEAHRLVTLVGSGGSGKTRLALQVGAELLDGSGDGVWFVDLAAIADPELVPQAIASALRLLGASGTPFDAVLSGLADQRCLLLLDNCEHVIDSAAKVTDAILGRCSGVSVLATSREPLRIDGEHLYRLRALRLPDAAASDVDTIAASDAVALFVERVRHVDPEFRVDEASAALVARICRRLDGIPLAIELAAARLRTMSLSDLESRLDDRFTILRGGSRTALPRQRTLDALVAWSWDLLNDAERVVLMNLSVFAGGWDLPGAEAVACGNGVEPYEVPRLLGEATIP